MKKFSYYVFWLTLLMGSSAFSQINFLGFDQEQCGLMEDSPYSYENNIDCMGGGGYKIYKNGWSVFFKCADLGNVLLKSLKALNDSTVYTIDATNTGPFLKAYKSVNSCYTFFTECCAPGEYFLGHYLLTPTTGFVVSKSNYNIPTLLVSLISNGNPYYYTDIDFNQNKKYYFPITGDPLCDLDSISFSISKAGNIIQYTIVWDSIWLNKDEVNSKKQLQIFPNPVIQYFSFSASSPPDIKSQIEIFNFSGIFVKSFAINNDNKYSISELPVGLYVVCIKSDQKNYFLKLQKQ